MNVEWDQWEVFQLEWTLKPPTSAVKPKRIHESIAEMREQEEKFFAEFSAATTELGCKILASIARGAQNDNP